MKLLSAMLVLFVAGLGGSSAFAADAPLPLLQIRPQDFWGVPISKLLTPPVTCDARKSSVCTVTVKVLQGKDSSGRKICSAGVPESVTVAGFKDAANKEILMVWALDTSEATDASYSYGFELNFGILLLSDAPPPQYYRSGAGDYGANPNSTRYFHYFNRFSAKQTASYLPIVLQTPNAGKEAPVMCAAVDPIMINSD